MLLSVNMLAFQMYCSVPHIRNRLFNFMSDALPISEDINVKSVESFLLQSSCYTIDHFTSAV